MRNAIPGIFAAAFLVAVALVALATPASPSTEPQPQSAEDLQKLVDIVEDKIADHGFSISALNKTEFPVTVTLDLPVLENYKSSASMPSVIVVPPRKKQLITRLSRLNARKVAKYTTQSTWLWGWHDDKPIDPVFTLPYPAGFAYRIVQGFNGAFSHQGKNALDFSLPEGSTICAARAGVVVEIEQRFSKSGITEEMKNRANRVLIQHADGTLGRYAHLQHDGALVKVGQKVKVGDSIGLSGATGFAQGPHLHFEVDRAPASGGNDYDTIPVRFAAAGKDGSEQTVDPREHDLLMRPFSPADAAMHTLPLNALQELTLCRSVDQHKPADVTDTFAADDTMMVYVRTNLTADHVIRIVVFPQAAASGDPPLYSIGFDKLSDTSDTFLVSIDLGRQSAVRGKCVLKTVVDDKELASAKFTVRTP